MQWLSFVVVTCLTVFVSSRGIRVREEKPILFPEEDTTPRSGRFFSILKQNPFRKHVSGQRFNFKTFLHNVKRDIYRTFFPLNKKVVQFGTPYRNEEQDYTYYQQQEQRPHHHEYFEEEIDFNDHYGSNSHHYEEQPSDFHYTPQSSHDSVHDHMVYKEGPLEEVLREEFEPLDFPESEDDLFTENVENDHEISELPSDYSSQNAHDPNHVHILLKDVLPVYPHQQEDFIPNPEEVDDDQHYHFKDTSSDYPLKKDDSEFISGRDLVSEEGIEENKQETTYVYEGIIPYKKP